MDWLPREKIVTKERRKLPLWIVHNVRGLTFPLGLTFVANRLKIVDRNLNRLNLKEGDKVPIKI